MNQLATNIIGLFATTYQQESCKEDCDTYEITIDLGTLNCPSIDELSGFISQIPERDDVFLSFIDYDIDYKRSRNADVSEFLQSVNSELQQKDNLKLRFIITKDSHSSCRSVYESDLFETYLKSKDFLTFLNIISSRIVRGELTFEYQEKDIPIVYSSSICFRRKGINSRFRAKEPEIRLLRLQKSRELCHWNRERVNILAEDMLFEQEDDNWHFELVDLLNRYCLVFVWMHLVDFVQFKSDHVEMILNGLKSYSMDIPIEGILQKDYDVACIKSMIDIYQWCYSFGDIQDKIMIIRNILSINIVPDRLGIDVSSYHAILSNFKIFQKENVQQYLSMRNALSDLLIKLQGQINKLADDYLGEFKKNIVAFFSFIVPTIIVRAMSKGNMLEWFSTGIIFMIVVSVFLSYVYYRFSRREYHKRSDMIKRQFELVKERYDDVLSEGEEKMIFSMSSEDDIESYSSFLKEREDCISVIWTGSLAIIFLASLFLFTLQIKL